MMKIYKFKDLTCKKKHSHFYQIILENKIWCAKPDSFNDDNEFKFELNYKSSKFTAELLSQVVTKYRTSNPLPPNLPASEILRQTKLDKIGPQIVEDLIDHCRNTIGVISFSIIKTDDHLWNEYGGKGNGVCIEIDIPDRLIGESYHRVRYVQEKIFHIDSFLESALFPGKIFKTYRNILLTKTRKWSQEEEMRFIGNRQNVNLIFDGNVREITFGAQVPEHTLKELEANIGGHCNANNIKIMKL